MSVGPAFRLAETGGWKGAEALLAMAVVFVVALLVVPLPAVMLDLFLVLSIASAFVVLMVTLQMSDPLEFSVFPAVLLLLTLYRLALNVSSTRLILGRGDAGSVIDAFGSFVIGGNYAVGVVIFLILVAINFVVITKGAGRVAEVAARFTLDAMPGRQMSIDGDLSAGLIDDAEARKRREEISRQADFYGAMDGAAKFVRGDAIAGLLITGINIVGGIFVGVVQRGLPLGSALSEYTLLTVGDGLVTQIPALIISTAAGVMVTRSAGETHMGDAVAEQIGRHPRALWSVAGILGLMGLVPGLPVLPFLGLGAGAGFLAYLAARRQEADAEEGEEGGEEIPVEATENPVMDLLQLDPIELNVGYGVIPLVDERAGGDLLDRISSLRRQAARELGFLIPPVRIRDDVSLPSNGYVLRLRGAEVARGEVMPRMLLALDTGTVSEPVPGIETRDPSYDMPARWIDPERRATAEARGYVVVEPSTVLATHLMETLKSRADELLGRQDVQEMVDTLRESYPALVDDVVPDKVPLGVLHRVLQRLLGEGIPIRDLVTILECLADAPEGATDPEALTERVRSALGPVIAERFSDDDGVVHAVTVGPRFEAALMELFHPSQGDPRPGMLDPDLLTELLSELEGIWKERESAEEPTVLLAPAGLRVGLRRLVEPVLPEIPVLSLAELPSRASVESVGQWEVTGAAEAA